MSSKSFSTHALVLKRVNTGESDRIVTLFTQDYGKIVSVAKGVRQMKSSKRAFLEPGNLVNAYFIRTKSLPLLTQAQLLTDHQGCKSSLIKMRQLSQTLEIIDRLFVEEQPEELLFVEVQELLASLSQDGSNTVSVRDRLTSIITQLGYQPPRDTRHHSISDYIAELTDRPMRSWQFLQVRQ
jgi:DNA repair protein RecO (recombination protein O)